jgi:hypothetical protein
MYHHLSALAKQMFTEVIGSIKMTSTMVAGSALPFVLILCIIDPKISMPYACRQKPISQPSPRASAAWKSASSFYVQQQHFIHSELCNIQIVAPGTKALQRLRACLDRLVPLITANSCLRLAMRN